METTMDCCESLTSSADVAARAAARRRLVRRLGLFAEIRARRRRPRSAGWSSSSCAARWTGSPPSRRSAIPTMPACMVRSRSTSNGRTRRCMLDSFFALHPAMPEFARMYREKKAAVVHAVATSYRDRSHFDGQDVLESGFAGPGRVQSGWLNRALEALPKGERVMSGARDRPDHAVGAARRGADRRLGAGRAAAGRRRYRDAARRTLRPPRSRAGQRRCRKACSSTRPRRATT